MDNHSPPGPLQHKKSNHFPDCSLLKIFCHLGKFELWKKTKLTGAVLIIVKQRIFDQARQDTFFIKMVLINVLISNTQSQPLIYNLIYGNSYQSNIKSVSQIVFASISNRKNNIDWQNRKSFLSSFSMEDKFHFILVFHKYEGCRKKLSFITVKTV